MEPCHLSLARVRVSNKSGDVADPESSVTRKLSTLPSGREGLAGDYRALPKPRSCDPSHFSNSFPNTFWAHFGTDRASFMTSPP